MKPLLLLLSPFLMLSACTGLVQDIDPARLPQADPELVVHCYLSPQDTVLTATVSQSRTSVGVQTDNSGFSAIPDARVTLSEGSQTSTLPFDAKQGIYKVSASRFSVQAGHTYQLTVVLPDGRRATASSRVPVARPVPEVIVDSVRNPGSLLGVDYYVTLRWTDAAGEQNYYQAAGDNSYGSVARTLLGNGTWDEIPFRAVNQVFFESYNESPFVLDTDRDGQMLTSGRGRILIYSHGTNSLPQRPFDLNVYLLSVNEAYYNYVDQVLTQARNNNNPFAEPTLIRSNITGGLGCFGAYNKTAIRLSL
ncbi:DUF4249 domain-containing protein [Spirosoma pomorum]